MTNSSFQERRFNLSNKIKTDEVRNKSAKDVHLFTVVERYGCMWLKIFQHNIDVQLFQSEAEAISSNKEGLFSILWIINDDFKINGKYEFMIEYPDYLNDNGINRWVQTNNPLDETERQNQKAIGFEPIELSWPYAYALDGMTFPFSGLTRSNYQGTLLDGTSSRTDWFFSIGAYTKQRYYYLPGFSELNKEVIFWLRSDGYKGSYRLKYQGKKATVLSFAWILINLH